MRPLSFLDTSFAVALHSARDQNHEIALRLWEGLPGDTGLVTTSLVFEEIATFFNSRGLHDLAVRIGRDLLDSPVVRLVNVDEGLFLEGWGYFVRHGDKDYSLTDCVSFVLMTRLGLRSALTFDHHFSQAGFERFPRA